MPRRIFIFMTRFNKTVGEMEDLDWIHLAWVKLQWWIELVLLFFLAV
jgi:hypothetical protein